MFHLLSSIYSINVFGCPLPGVVPVCLKYTMWLIYIFPIWNQVSTYTCTNLKKNASVIDLLLLTLTRLIWQ